MAWSIQAPVAGVKFEGRQEILKGMTNWDKPGKATLKRDSLNTHDPKAVMVLNEKGEQVGFLPADLVDFFAAIVDAGRPITARFQSVRMHEEYGSYSATIWITVNTKGIGRQAPKKPTPPAPVTPQPDDMDW